MIFYGEGHHRFLGLRKNTRRSKYFGTAYQVTVCDGISHYDWLQWQNKVEKGPLPLARRVRRIYYSKPPKDRSKFSSHLFPRHYQLPLSLEF